MSYINRNRARQTGTNRATQAEISNGFWLSFPGRVRAMISYTELDEEWGQDTTNSVDPSGLRWIVISIWNQQGLSVGHAVASETNGDTFLSSFPYPSWYKNPQVELNWQQTLDREGRGPDGNYLVWVPDDNAFNAEVARERNMAKWDWDPNNRNQTNCVNAITRSLNAGGRSAPTFMWPGNFGAWLFQNQGPGIYSLPNVPWQNGISINPSTGEIGNTGLTFTHY